MKKIPLTQGKFTLVDDEDYEYLNQWKWYRYCDPTRKTSYAVRNITVGSNPCKQRTIRMHRLIMKVRSAKQIDHVNHNGLDNRKMNLRICSHTQNRWNIRKQGYNTSGFKGVSFHKRDKKYAAYITKCGETIWLGYFNTAEEASAVYDQKARELFGEFALTNKMERILSRE